MKRLLRWLGSLVLLFLFYIIAVISHGTITDWQPEAVLPGQVYNGAAPKTITDTSLTLALWNLGYAGLGAECDFFFDSGGFFRSHGKTIRPSAALVDKYLNGAEDFVRSTEADFYLFQEVDFNSKRSYYTNQLDSLGAQRPAFARSAAHNYKVDRVPLPILEPWQAYGKVDGGVATLSRWATSNSTRLQLPGSFDWPNRVFHLDRCLLVDRYPTAWGKELVLINGHLSAYDQGGVLKKQQMVFLQQLAQKEYDAGHYVIIGADWNQCPPGFTYDQLAPAKGDGYGQSNVAADFMPPGWTWASDDQVPTNRKMRDVYDRNTTFQTVIDFYLLSPNVRLVSCQNIDQDFAYSDHQPVVTEVVLER